jgi:hypothetical protein
MDNFNKPMMLPNPMTPNKAILFDERSATAATDALISAGRMCCIRTRSRGNRRLSCTLTNAGTPGCCVARAPGRGLCHGLAAAAEGILETQGYGRILPRRDEEPPPPTPSRRSYKPDICLLLERRGV